MARFFLGFAAVNGFLAVALGAFAAHGLKDRLPANLLAIFDTAVDYQVAHSLALILVAIMLKVMQPGKLLTTSGWAFVVGIVLFSGSLYALALTGQTKLGAITPLGGLCFLIGWASLVLYAFKRAR